MTADRARYKRVKPDKRGWIWLAPVRLWLGLTRDPQGGYSSGWLALIPIRAKSSATMTAV